MEPLSVSPKVQKVSELMRTLMESASHEDQVSVGRILHIFGVRGFAFLLLVLAVLNVAIFMVPFVSIVFGLPMVILSVQMVLGLQTPVFPQLVRRRIIPRDLLVRGLEQSIHSISKIERAIKPRFTFLSIAVFNRAHGLVALLLAIMVTLPIPLFNIPPSLGLALLAIGILQRDGLFIVAGYAVGGCCLVLFKSLGHFAHTMVFGH